MNKTYRILPSAEDMLLRLVRGLALSDAERALLRACTLRHVEVSAEENTWELVVGTPSVLDDELLERIAEQVAENYQLSQALVQQNVVALESAVAPLWERVINEAAAGDTALFHTLRQSEYAVDGNVIRLSVPGNFGTELFMQSAAAKRIEDAVRNAKAAVEEGIVPGGGVALLQASKAAKVEGLDDDELVGASIVLAAAQGPLRQIATNAGLEGGVIAEKVAGLPKGHGLNAATGEYVDMVDAGIIDPAKVTRSALQNAASIAALFLTTEAVIADKPEKAPAAAGAPGMDEMGGMGGF